MADKLLVALLRDPLGRMCLVITALFFLSGIGALTLMVGTTMQPEAALASTPAPVPAPGTVPKAEVAVASVAAPAAKEPSANSVIEATFGVLPIDIKPAAPKQHVAALDAPTQVAASQPVKPRVVKTVAIDATVTGSVTPATAAEKAIPQTNPLMAYQAVQAGQQAQHPAAQQKVQVASLSNEPQALPEIEEPAIVAPVPKVRPEGLEAKPEAKAEPKKAKPEAEQQAAAAEKSGAAAKLGTVNVGNQAVNVRSGPSSKNGKVFFLQAGQQVAAIEIQKGWVRIRDDEGREGWVYSSYLANFNGAAKQTQTAALETPKAAAQPAAIGGTMVVRGSGVTVRSGPSKSHGQVFTLGAGEPVTVNQNQKGWLFITDAQGRSGWAYSRYLSNG